MERNDTGCGTLHPPTLQQLGWTEDHAAAFAQYPDHYKPGRVSCRHEGEPGCGVQ